MVNQANLNILDLDVELVCVNFPNDVPNNQISLDCTKNNMLGVCPTCDKSKP